MCLYPKLIKNPKYKANKKNGGKIPAVFDIRTKVVPIECGKCMECKKKKSRDWQIRLLEDVRHKKNGVFVTLTFSNESIKELSSGIHRLEGYELDNEIATLGVRRFTERWRKEYKKAPRHWLVTELGHNGTENIHLHGIIWTDKREDIHKHWKYGFTWIQGENKNINEKIVNYITKYINKVDFQHKEYNPKILCSKGIGKGYLNRYDSKLNKYNGENTKEYYTTRTGHKIALPMYWRNKLYTDEEREKLWIHKLDQETRYVGGEKIDISKSEEEYYKLLEYYRKKNKEYGYGDNAINWDRKEYEKQRRILNHKKRTNKDYDGTIEEQIIKDIQPPKVLEWDELEEMGFYWKKNGEIEF